MSEITGIGSLPQLPAVLPAEVRNGGKEAKEAYGAALGFERMLVKQLTKSLTDSAAIGGGEDGQSGSPAAYREMISDGIADAITKGGGIGLAQDLYAQVAPAQQVDGGTDRARKPTKVDIDNKQVRPEASK